MIGKYIHLNDLQRKYVYHADCWYEANNRRRFQDRYRSEQDQSLRIQSYKENKDIPIH